MAYTEIPKIFYIVLNEGTTMHEFMTIVWIANGKTTWGIEHNDLITSSNCLLYSSLCNVIS